MSKTGKYNHLVFAFATLAEPLRWRRLLDGDVFGELLAFLDGLYDRALEVTGGARLEKEREGETRLFEFHHAGQALAAGLAIQQSVANARYEPITQALKRLAKSADPLRLACKIGIAQGPGFIPDGGEAGEVVSMAKNIASRLQTLALPGQILTTADICDYANQLEGKDFGGRAGLPGLAETKTIAYGRYIVKGLKDRPLEVVEVGITGIAPLEPPRDTNKAWNEAAVWRPEAGRSILNRPEFILERKLGEGGFGEVWLAYRGAPGKMKPPGGRRVFKFCFNAERLRTFRREKTFSRLLEERLGNRDDMVPLLNWSLYQPPFYIESMYVDGGNLLQWAELQGGIEQVPLDTRLSLFCDIAGAAQAAHDESIIHKDIKPSNILITTRRADNRPHAMLTDFGISYLADPTFLQSLNTTQPGAATLMDTLEGSRTRSRLYAAPEYLDGAKPSAKGDVYALGVLLYQLTAGNLENGLPHDWRKRIGDPALAEAIDLAVMGNPEKRLSSAGELVRLVKGRTRRRRWLMARRFLLRTSVAAVLAAAAYVGYRHSEEVGMRKLNEQVEKVSEKEVSAQADLALAETYFGQGLFDKAFELRLGAAKQGNAQAQYLVGSAFKSGLGAVSDPDEARAWFELAAEQGHQEAQYVLGTYHMSIFGDSLDDADRRKGLSWMGKAADQGNKEAIRAIILFQTPDWDKTDAGNAEILAWLHKGADADIDLALVNLGMAHMRGLLGLKRDLIEARTWFKKGAEAVRKGIEDNRTMLRVVAPMFDSNESGQETQREIIMVLVMHYMHLGMMFQQIGDSATVNQIVTFTDELEAMLGVPKAERTRPLNLRRR